MRGFTRTVLALTSTPLVHRLVRDTRPGRALVGRFVAGDDLDAGVEATRRLSAEGRRVSLDLLGEEVLHRDAALSALQGYLACLDRIQGEGLAANISVKLTQLGLAFDPELAAHSLDALAEAARQAGTTVTIDMEGSRFTAPTVELYARLQPRHGNLGLCLQASLRRTPADLERLAPLGGHIRLCKGAYLEPPDIAYQGRGEVDAAFARLLIALMGREEVLPAVATHDHRLIRLAVQLAESRQGPWEVQMLYGVRERLQHRLVESGTSLRVYVPYGSEWYAYLTRRLAERPANLLFFLRAVAGGRAVRTPTRRVV